ncbi:MAG: radical SAM family heme chaperone HemW [Pseudomonadota bacterium]|nr:radical SAM family heme chaperone HemW [Pseudomonadota bacterium]
MNHPTAAGFGVYVHWPFCKAKCPYCDFNSHVRHGAVDSAAFAEALASELASLHAMTQAREVTSVFFGGGTPSLMPPEAVTRVLDAVDRLWGLPDGAEVTLEANPTSAEARNFRGYRAAGVNRVSVGVQALDDRDLRTLGRQHTAHEAVAAFRLAAGIFPRVSFDLIYARSGQGEDQWRRELAAALAEQQGHMSLYQLTIEEGTRYFDLHAAGSLEVPDEDLSARLFDATQEMTAAAGLDAYEVSNHAAPGHQSRHNLLYWRYGEYAGVGPGAHSRIVRGDGARMALVSERHPETWRDLVANGGHGRVEETSLSRSEQGMEFLLMGMRLGEGISLGEYETISGQPLARERLQHLSDAGLVSFCNGGAKLAATQRGRRVLNSLIAALTE